MHCIYILHRVLSRVISGPDQKSLNVVEDDHEFLLCDWLEGFVAFALDELEPAGLVECHSSLLLSFLPKIALTIHYCHVTTLGRKNRNKMYSCKISLICQVLLKSVHSNLNFCPIQLFKSISLSTEHTVL